MSIGRRILLLEDDPAIADTVRYALEREAFVVTQLGLVHEALAFLDQAHDLLILDVGLPDGNGLDVCRAARARNAAWPVLMLSARSEEVDLVLGLELGADDYVTKPFSPKELLARVRALLRRAELKQPVKSTSPAMVFEVDTASARISMCGVPLALTRREFGLLQLLIKQPSRIFSREALLNAVWGNSSDSADRTVDTHIKTLRTKLREIKPELDLIHTHRGMGYSLELYKDIAISPQ